MKTFTDEKGAVWEPARAGEIIPYSGWGVMQEGWKLIKPVKQQPKYSVTLSDGAETSTLITIGLDTTEDQAQLIKEITEGFMYWIFDRVGDDMPSDILDNVRKARQSMRENN